MTNASFSPDNHPLDLWMARASPRKVSGVWRFSDSLYSQFVVLLQFLAFSSHEKRCKGIRSLIYISRMKLSLTTQSSSYCCRRDSKHHWGFRNVSQACLRNKVDQPSEGVSSVSQLVSPTYQWPPPLPPRVSNFCPRLSSYKLSIGPIRILGNVRFGVYIDKHPTTETLIIRIKFHRSDHRASNAAIIYNQSGKWNMCSPRSPKAVT